MKTKTIEELVGLYPKLAELVRSEHKYDGWQSEFCSFMGVWQPPPDLNTMEAYSHCGDGCWSKIWDEQGFDAIMADGTVISRFVHVGEKVGTALKRLGISPALIVHHTHTGGGNDADWHDGYTDYYKARVYQMTD